MTSSMEYSLAIAYFFMASSTNERVILKKWQLELEKLGVLI